jgi:N-dimethylarginine dimethylaminohydrolase
MESEALEQVIYRADTVLRMPRDEGMIMDAANVLRLNDSMLYLLSPSGNLEAYHWLCDHFPDDNIELCNFYSGVHIDSTIVPIREGLVLLNASRVTEENCPGVFEDWDKIWVQDVVEQEFYRYPYASKWIGLNMLAVNPSTVIIDWHQIHLRQQLESYGIDTIPLPMRHSRTLGGGFHCVTLDLVRNHK